ncbi:MAG TPA: phosphoribosylanthranilate isomerase [Bacteroidales bacterium]|nr:phosphoribosylanthranilate isomerase [Bacteroidales bacterium]
MPRIKICCIKSIEEAKMAIAAGASAIGLVGRMPSGPGPISDDLIRIIAASVPPPIATFLLTSETTAEGIINHHRKVNTSTIQIVDMPDDGAYDKIRSSLPSVKLVQVIHVIDENSVSQAVRISGHADALLLDSGNPFLKIKELGGTGRVHNWVLSRKIVEAAKCPVFLAGGLKPENVRMAVEQVQPFGIDVCSGIRTNGDLDPDKLSRFIATVRQCDNARGRGR